jgi:LCP family protein required for cell wall assembly
MSRSERRRQAEAEKAKKKTRSAKFEEKVRQEEELAKKAETPETFGDITTKTKVKKIDKFKNWFKGLKPWKKVLFISAIVFLILAIAVGAMAYGYFNGVFEEVYKETPEDYDLSLVDVDGYYNILLLGVDTRDMSNFEGSRSDAIMILSINKDTSDVKLLSIYRDTFLKMGSSSSYDKLTHACAFGGPEMTMKTLNQALDLNISNYVVANFKAVADVVDAVGGIEVDVQQYEIQQLNKYTIETAENIGTKNYNLVEKAGVQTLEGVQAVSYGRIRKGVGDDYKRTERMRTVITLVADKMKDMSFGEIKKIIKLVTPQVQTNLSRNNILGLAIRLPQYNIVGTAGWPYSATDGSINGVSYLFPNNLRNNVIQLHKEFFMQEDYVPSKTVDTISETIISKINAASSSGELENEKVIDTNTSQSGSGSSTSGNTSGSGSNGTTGSGSNSDTSSGTTGGSSDGSNSSGNNTDNTGGGSDSSGGGNDPDQDSNGDTGGSDIDSDLTDGGLSQGAPQT